MKKTLVALAVMAVAGTANAGIELYNKDGVTVNMKGDIEIQYVQAIGSEETLKQKIDDADFGFDTRYAMDDATQVGFYYEFSGADNDSTKPGQTGTFKVGNVYVGFYNDQFGSLKIGKLDTQMDDAGIGSDYLFGITKFFKDAGFGGHEAVRYDLDKGAFYFGLGAIQNKHQANSGLKGEDGTHLDAKIGYRVADFDIRAFGSQSKIDNAPADDETLTLLALEGTYSGFENLNLQAAIYSGDYREADSNAKTYALAADYTMNAWKFAGAFSRVDEKDSDDVNTWFLNAGYQIAPSTTAYVEIGDNSKDNTDMGYGVGIKAEF